MWLYLEAWLCSAMLRTGIGWAWRRILSWQRSSTLYRTASVDICMNWSSLGNGATNIHTHISQCNRTSGVLDLTACLCQEGGTSYRLYFYSPSGRDGYSQWRGCKSSAGRVLSWKPLGCGYPADISLVP